MKQRFLIEIPEAFQTYIYENNRKVIPSSAAITVYRPGSGEKLKDNAAMAVGSDGLLSYELSATDNGIAGTDYKAVVCYSLNSKTYYTTLFYDVVRSRLSKVVTDDDVINELPQIKDNGWKVRGTVKGGSNNTIVDAELKRYEDGYFTGGLAYSVELNETREITGFTSSTGTVATTPFSSAVTAGNYILTRSYSTEIQRAFEKIEERIAGLGKRPHLVLDPYDLREAHIYMSVAEVCKGLAASSGDLWWDMWKEYEKKGDTAFGSINFKYDYSEDGFISGGENSAGPGIRRAARG